jgi:hypothetical protein
MPSQLGSSLPSPANFQNLCSNPMLHLRLFDGYYNARGAAIGVFAPIVATENAQRLSQCLIETLRRDLVGMLDALRVLACHPACSDSHRFRKAVRFLFATIRSRSAEETGIAGQSFAGSRAPPTWPMAVCLSGGLRWPQWAAHWR